MDVFRFSAAISARLSGEAKTKPLLLKSRAVRRRQRRQKVEEKQPQRQSERVSDSTILGTSPPLQSLSCLSERWLRERKTSGEADTSAHHHGGEEEPRVSGRRSSFGQYVAKSEPIAVPKSAGRDALGAFGEDTSYSRSEDVVIAQPDEDHGDIFELDL